MIGNGGTAATVVACCPAPWQQDVIGRRPNPRSGRPR